MSRWVCLKERYQTREAAERALADIRHARGKGRGKKGKTERRAYFHTPCEAYHLTSMARTP